MKISLTLEKKQMVEVKFKDASELLNEADILLFRGKGFWSYFIKRASEGRYSHVGLATAHGANGSKIWECVEFKENKGGRIVNLQKYVELYEGKIDVYRASSAKKVYEFMPDGSIDNKNIVLKKKKITNTMRSMAGLPYGWKRIAWMAQRKVPFLRWLYNIESVSNDENKDLIYPVCSTAVAYSFAKNGYDLVHNRADMATEPSDISRSPLLSYLFTIIS